MKQVPEPFSPPLTLTPAERLALLAVFLFAIRKVWTLVGSPSGARPGTGGFLR